MPTVGRHYEGELGRGNSDDRVVGRISLRGEKTARRRRGNPRTSGPRTQPVQRHGGRKEHDPFKGQEDRPAAEVGWGGV